jgi:hypothetical protein
VNSKTLYESSHGPDLRGGLGWTPSHRSLETEAAGETDFSNTLSHQMVPSPAGRSDSRPKMASR